MILGGYILQPRIIDESELIHEPPIVRELWLYLLRKVSHTTTEKFTRGKGFFGLEDISDDLHWYVGFRKMKYSKPQITKTLRKLRERNMIATMKATRGIFITICKYEYYQDPKNYEGNDEKTMKETRRKWEGRTKHKKVKNDKNEIIVIQPEISWKTDFEIYKSECADAFKKMSKDQLFKNQILTLYPDYDFEKSLAKCYLSYWNTEDGWDKKKKSNTQTINWKSTITKTIQFNLIKK